ncbi:MAG: threonine--tRNA ligase [Nanoarchaeota archaeon]|nr:threonine--tRNA ligase [Nanoarchaeota archaeon]MBU1321896.1 threonine--tRNA ligase [Nanoarchaeota archaeon]MBU1597671.1 threonine--tRNA ligase [Nanoarchaeota archaeon]MBU2442234.1 threonine--tRNA ligase [Nanoarchaeota archaeon]
MAKIKLKIKGKTVEVDKGIKAEDLVKAHFQKEMDKALAARIDNHFIDMNAPVDREGEFDILTFDDEAGMDLFRHSSSHVMALAVKRLYKNVKVSIGPSIEDGFYYDFDNLKITTHDLKKIEAEIKKILHDKLEFERKEVSKAEALKIFKDEPYKIELINELPEGETITTYKLGEFEDLCRGPHVSNSKRIGAIKLVKLAGAYWRGDCKKKMLTRIYGISFPDKKMLNDWVVKMEEAEKRDHRRIGKEMELYSFHDAAPGMPFFHDRGAYIWDKLVVYTTELMRKRDYELNITPIILHGNLWKQSGHFDHYKDNMYYTTIDENQCAVKPMNCPGNILIFTDRLHSYKELPIKAGEFGLVHRHELSGVLSGLFRVRAFTQDDAHVFCMEEQIEEQVKELIDFMHELYTTFGFEYRMELSTKPEKAMGDPKMWDLAEQKLKAVLEKNGKPYKLNVGEGAFYGPKIDFHLKDALGRDWQCGTIQLDFQMPEKFNLTYDGKDGHKHRPVMIHRACLGSVERFMGMLVEHFAGKFPLWISPVQVKILPIAERHMEYGHEVLDKFKKAGFRAELDYRSESTSKKVRDAQIEKFNYILVVGDQEIESKSVNVRTRNNEILGARKVDEFIKELLVEIDKKLIK